MKERRRERESTHLPTDPSTHTHCHTLVTFTCDFVFGGHRVKGKAARIWSSPLSLRSDQTGHRGLGEEREERERAHAPARVREREERERARPVSPIRHTESVQSQGGQKWPAA